MNTAIRIGVLVLEGLLGIFLAYSVYLNFSNSPTLMKQWAQLRLARWYTRLAGVLLTVGVGVLLAGLVVPVVGGLALLWMVAYFAVATLTHVVRRDKLSGVAVPFVFLVVFVVLAALRWTTLHPLLTRLHLA